MEQGQGVRLLQGKLQLEYDVGSDFTMDGKPCGRRAVLSDNDKRFAWKCYPIESGHAGTFNIHSKIPTQSNTPTLTPFRLLLLKRY